MGCGESKDTRRMRIEKSHFFHIKKAQENYKNYLEKIVNLDKLYTSLEDINGIYEIDPKIFGQGKFGTIRMATLKNNHKNKEFAIKTINKNKLKKNFQLLQRELQILRNHPNIIKFYESYQDEKYLHIVMESCRGGDMFDRLVKKGPYSERNCASYIKKILLAIQYLHERGIAHRDIKPENFMFVDNTEDSEIKIIDFGLSKIFFSEDVKEPPQSLQTVVGTPLYVAPEIFKGQRIYYRLYDYRCDIWSVGIVMFVLLSGSPPFEEENMQNLILTICEGKFNFNQKEWRNISQQAKNLIKSLIQVDPDNRIPIKNALQHEWFKMQLQQKHMDHNIIKILSSHHGGTKFKKEVLKVFCNQLNIDEISMLGDAFRECDKENKGEISLIQLESILKEQGYVDSYNEINQIIDNFRIEKQEIIKYSDFVQAAISQKKYLNNQALWNLFRYFDVDHQNYITSKNLKEILAREGKNLPEKVLFVLGTRSDHFRSRQISLNTQCLLIKYEYLQKKSNLAAKSFHFSRSITQ